MKHHSFFLRLFGGNLLLVAVIITFGFAVSYRYLNRQYLQRDTADQQRVAEVLAGTLESRWPAPPEAPTRAEMQPLCRKLMAGSDLRLTVMSHPDGRVLGDSEADPATMEPHRTPDRPEVLAAMNGRTGQSTRESETLGVQFRYIAVPVRRDGQVVGAVRVAKRVTTIARGQDYVRQALLWAGLAGAVAAVLLGLLISWIWYRPLRQIAHAAGKIASGNLTHRAHIRGPGEMEDLARALNEMRSSLATQMGLAARERKNLKAVVTNLDNGIVALDRDRSISYMNRVAIELMAPGESDVVGRNVQSVIRIVDVIDMLTQVPPGGRLSRQVEVERGQRRVVLDLTVTDVSEGETEGICTLLTAHNVTEITRTARMKAEFVANASHELRTPLATIKATAESLTAVGAGDEEAMGKFVSILLRNVQRLENLTNDLLDLHLVEGARSKLRLEEIVLGEMVSWVRANFGESARKKGVELTAKADEPDHRLRSDRKLIELIVQNLVDNAIKFTPAGGEVTCRYERNGSGTILRVSDTGCGIPPEIRSRVFERFFQADPSRSGDTNHRGTGLGLAIVKHAVEQLGAQIELRSEVGEGTTIDVIIPNREL